MVREGSARDVVHLALQVDRTQIRPWIGVEAACSLAIPLTIGLIVNHPTAGAWAAMGAFLTSFSLYQPGFRIRARVVAAAGVVVGVAVFLGAITGIEHAGIYPVVAAWTFLGGLLVAVGPNAALVGVTSSVGLLVASSLDASASLAFEDGALALCGGLGAAILVFAFHRHETRAEDRALAACYRTLASYSSGICRGQSALPDGDPFDTLAATLAVPGPRRYQDLADRDRALAAQSERLRTGLAALTAARGRLTRQDYDHPAVDGTVAAIDHAARAFSRVLGDIADSCAVDRRPPKHSSVPGRLDLDPALDELAARRSTGDPDATVEVSDHLDNIVNHLRTAQDLLADTAPTDTGASSADKTTPDSTAPHATPRQLPTAERQSPLADAALALRSNLTFRSTAFRHAVRLAAVATLATLLYRIVDPVDGYWIVVAVIFVLKPEFGVTLSRSLLRVVGTLAGVAAATFVLASLQPGPVVLAVLTVVVSAFAFTLFTTNYGLFAVFLTCLTVFLAAFLGLPPMTAVANRATDNLIGSGLTVVAFLVWPTWVATEVPRLVSTLLLAEGRLGQRILAAFSHPDDQSNSDFDQLISTARLSRSNAEAAVERMAHEPHGSDKGTVALTAAKDMLAQMHRMGMASLALLQHLRSVKRGGHDGLNALDPLCHQLQVSFEALARSVETDAESPPSGLGVVLQQVRGRLGQGQWQTVVENEADLMVDVVDTTIEIYNAGRGRPERST
jgi:uncharacterized membrane protein YccC